ncbi:MAG: response regulator [Anaerolineae bacterium]|nr:response regulator [Anaerolineae bacterium]
MKRVLVVDDERLTRVSLAAFLEELGYEAAVAGDGDEAIRLQAQAPFDVCIVDIRLPGKDGVETIKALHQIAPEAYFIIFTGSPQFTIPPVLEDLGMSARDIVRKPVVDMDIFAALIVRKDASSQERSG